MKFGDIRSGQIGIWLIGLFYFIVISTLIGLVVHSRSNIWLSLGLYFFIYLSILMWDYRPSVYYAPKRPPLRTGLWMYSLFPILMAIGFIIFLPRDIKSLIHAPSPKLKNFNDYW